MKFGVVTQSSQRLPKLLNYLGFLTIKQYILIQFINAPPYSYNLFSHIYISYIPFDKIQVLQQLQKFQENGLYQFILSKNRAKEKMVKKQKQIAPLRQIRPSTAFVESKGKQKYHMNFGLQLESFSTLQPKLQNFEDLQKNNSQHQASSTPHQKIFVNDQKILRAMSALRKIKNQRAFRPCPFTLGFNIEQCSIKPKTIKQRSISQLQQIKSLNRTEIMKYKRHESPQTIQKPSLQSQFTKWEQYDDSNLFDLNFLNNNLFKYELQ